MVQGAGITECRLIRGRLLLRTSFGPVPSPTIQSTWADPPLERGVSLSLHSCDSSTLTPFPSVWSLLVWSSVGFNGQHGHSMPSRERYRGKGSFSLKATSPFTPASASSATLFSGERDDPEFAALYPPRTPQQVSVVGVVPPDPPVGPLHPRSCPRPRACATPTKPLIQNIQIFFLAAIFVVIYFEYRQMKCIPNEFPKHSK